MEIYGGGTEQERTENGQRKRIDRQVRRNMARDGRRIVGGCTASWLHLHSSRTKLHGSEAYTHIFYLLR